MVVIVTMTHTHTETISPPTDTHTHTHTLSLSPSPTLQEKPGPLCRAAACMSFAWHQCCSWPGTTLDIHKVALSGRCNELATPTPEDRHQGHGDTEGLSMCHETKTKLAWKVWKVGGLGGELQDGIRHGRIQKIQR